MGVFAKLRAAISESHNIESMEDLQQRTDCTGVPQSATCLLPGSAVVQVSDLSMVTVASLAPGKKILGMDMGAGTEFIWATLQNVETLPMTTTLQHEIVVGLGGDDSAFLKAEQVILTRDRKKKTGMRPVRQLRIGVDSVVVFDAHGLRWTSNISEEAKKIDSLQPRLVREEDPTEGLYKLTMGSTNHALLVSYHQDSQFLAVNCSNPKLKSSADPKMEVKNKSLDRSLLFKSFTTLFEPCCARAKVS